ncbi:hypothetical protein Desal_2104 [Maridesulfovibrio salexigens DSM 2638]|uniref:MORN repeat-containing protein n=2 Tax=Maridesulfovibrio salexigens TaxID=880 RepID=C6BVW1_MARSD|nr:hypothetical protein Desal_2104 [Maridesulfovibrio salexigens DSM 2638]
MKHTCKTLLLFIITIIFSASPLLATDMSQGLQCPPGWNDNRAARGNDLIKQCISPAQDAAIELYAAPGQEVPLGALLDMWAREMTQRGLPFQNKVSEVPGQVSGYPAVTRTYSGQTRDGNRFDSHLVASRYNGVNYVFQGFALKGHSQAWHQLRNSMNTWYYPGAGQQNYNQQQGGLPLGAGSSGNTPYGNQQASSNNNPYANTPYSTQQHTTGNSLPTISGTFITDQKDYWAGQYYYRIYRFNGDGTLTTGTKNVANGKIQMDKKNKRYRISKSGNNIVLSSGGSCTEGYVTDTENNQIRRFKSGCYSPGGKAMYFKKIPDNSLNMGQSNTSASPYPKIAGTFIADKKDYWGGSYHYRMYLFNGDGTFTSGEKNAASGKVKMSGSPRRYKVKKSGKSYVVTSGGSCTEGFVTDLDRNMIIRFKSGCYTSGGKAMYFDLVQ